MKWVECCSLQEGKIYKTSMNLYFLFIEWSSHPSTDWHNALLLTKENVDWWHLDMNDQVYEIEI
jgi:hypothetical protein